MTDLQTVSVNGVTPATQLVAEGDPPTLIGNKDITTSLWISRNNACIPARPQDTIEITPQSWVVVDGKEDVFGITTGPVINVNLVPGGVAFFQSGITGGGFIVNPSGAFFYQGAPGPGTLICAITGTQASGTDQYGNQYTPGGMCIVAQPNATSLFSIVDNASPPDLLASIASDGSFSTEGQLNAGSDLTVGGLSVPNDIIPPLPQGVLARTNIFASALPAPATPTASEFYLYELDVDFPNSNREILLVIETMTVALSGAGKLRITIYATTDGTQPTNASAVIASVDQVANATANLAMRTNPVVHQFSPAGGTTWRFLVSLNTFSTGSGAPTLQVQQLSSNPGTDGFTNTQGRFSVYDMGQSVPNTGRAILATAGGSGGGTKNYTKTYTSTGSHCYQGANGSNPNLKINDNGRAYVGGDIPDTYNGSAKTWFTFNTGTITGDLSGATINWVKIYLNNNHTWYGSGMTCPVGYDSKSSFGGTAGDPSGGGIDAAETHFNEGQSKWFTVPNAFATNFQSGAANTIVLFRNTTSLTYYGYFAGNNGCQIQINYTK